MRFFNFFKKKEKDDTKNIEGQDDTTEEQNDEALALFEVRIEKDGDVVITCEWADNNQLVSEVYAEMLYYLTSGNFSGHIANVLLSHGQDCEEDIMFVSRLLVLWKNLMNSKQNSPLVKPSEVFNTKPDLTR